MACIVCGAPDVYGGMCAYCDTKRMRNPNYGKLGGGGERGAKYDSVTPDRKARQVTPEEQIKISQHQLKKIQEEIKQYEDLEKSKRYNPQEALKSIDEEMEKLRAWQKELTKNYKIKIYNLRGALNENQKTSNSLFFTSTFDGILTIGAGIATLTLSGPLVFVAGAATAIFAIRWQQSKTSAENTEERNKNLPEIIQKIEEIQKKSIDIIEKRIKHLERLLSDENHRHRNRELLKILGTGIEE